MTPSFARGIYVKPIITLKKLEKCMIKTKPKEKKYVKKKLTRKTVLEMITGRKKIPSGF